MGPGEAQNRGTKKSLLDALEMRRLRPRKREGLPYGHQQVSHRVQVEPRAPGAPSQAPSPASRVSSNVERCRVPEPQTLLGQPIFQSQSERIGGPSASQGSRAYGCEESHSIPGAGSRPGDSTLSEPTTLVLGPEPTL